MPVGANELIFLVGLHGTGKSTIGRWLQSNRGWRHISVGDFARKARRREKLADVPLSLLAELARQDPQQRMSPRLVGLLLGFINSWNGQAPVVCDGFPSDPMHVSLLPPHARIIHVTCSERESRLKMRSETTRRLWTPGAPSRRDLALPLVLDAAGGMLQHLSNDADIESTMVELLKAVG